MQTRDFAERHQVAVFFVLALLLSGLWWGALFVVQPAGPQGSLTEMGLSLVYVLWGSPLVGPALAGIGLTAILGGRQGVRGLLGGLTRWRVSAGWYAVAVLGVPLLALAVLAILAAAVSPRFVPALPREPAVLLVIAIAGGVSSLLEELGWTGFALPRLLARRRALAAGLLLGVVWGLWHITINVWAQTGPRGDSAALATYLLGTGTAFLPLVAYRVLIAWVYVNSRDSLLLAWLAHWFLIVGLAPLAFGGTFVPVLSPTETLQFYAAFTAALWIAVGGVAAFVGAGRLSPEGGQRSAPIAPRPRHVPAGS